MVNNIIYRDIRLNYNTHLPNIKQYIFIFFKFQSQILKIDIQKNTKHICSVCNVKLDWSNVKYFGANCIYSKTMQWNTDKTNWMQLYFHIYYFFISIIVFKPLLINDEINNEHFSKKYHIFCLRYLFYTTYRWYRERVCLSWRWEFGEVWYIGVI